MLWGNGSIEPSEALLLAPVSEIDSDLQLYV